MWKSILILICFLQFYVLSSNLYVFTNRSHTFGKGRVIITLQSLHQKWFTTKVSLNGYILVDYFQTNSSERKEAFLWYRTSNLEKTLAYFGITTDMQIPYDECYFHASEVNFFSNGFFSVVALITSDGFFGNELQAKTYTFVKTNLHITCEPTFYIPRCHDSSRPLHYETSKVVVIRAVFTRHCPMDNFIQYYWTLHDSTETELLGFLAVTMRPEFKIKKYLLNLSQQSPLNRMVLVRVNAKIVGRRVPLVAR
ncbi:uncharacterized protein LOC117150011, partial [Drosophila mauritiana]|uniref:Uncharacterized protein LOC117150011 n=1 Tax=Drosophila mauritiana TaxID=7226 RepID=A0A6P8LDT9_DROMA